ncbi:MAG TPA: 50S ribosomal protein L7/L12 [Planctomycetes bacterium]|nr:50S ribosomal protein L7/L12 [Planctomycetota bacterium]
MSEQAQATAARSEKVAQIIEDIKQFKVFELVELVKALEAEFGVSAAPIAVAAAAGAPAAAPEAEEQTSFDVILKSYSGDKIQCIKAVRQLTNLGLKEAKALVEGLPKPIKEGATKEEVQKIKEQLTAVGGEIELK